MPAADTWPASSQGRLEVLCGLEGTRVEERGESQPHRSRQCCGRPSVAGTEGAGACAGATPASAVSERKGGACYGAHWCAGAPRQEWKLSCQAQQGRLWKSACERVMREGLSPRKTRKIQAAAACRRLPYGTGQLFHTAQYGGGRTHQAPPLGSHHSWQQLDQCCSHMHRCTWACGACM